MKSALLVLAVGTLLAGLGASLLVLAGRIEPTEFHKVFLLCSLGWFVLATVWNARR